MPYNIIISEAAKNEIIDALFWYKKQEKKLSGQLGNSITTAVKSIKTNPLKTQIKYIDTRIHFLNKFPYGIHYTISNFNIIIIAFYHTSRNINKL